MKEISAILLLIILLFTSCSKQEKKVLGDPKKGLTTQYLPQHIKDLYKVEQGENPAYYKKADSMYKHYWNQGLKDSALFCLIAWHEVLDQNYIYDSSALDMAKNHFYQGINTLQNQGELLKLGYYIGSMYYSGTEADSSIKWFYLTMQHPYVLPFTRLKCYTMLSNTYANINKLDSAIILDHLKIDYCKTFQDTINLAITKSNLSVKYKYIYALDLARQYALEAIETAGLTNDTFTKIMVRDNFVHILALKETFSPEIERYTHEINHFMNHFSKKNLTLKYAQTQCNMLLYDFKKDYDSMAYWVRKYKEITTKRGGSAQKDYLVYEGRYKNFTNQTITNTKEIANAANEYLQDKEYKGAHALFMVLLNYAERSKDFEKAYWYRDTLNLINKKLIEVTNKGKLYELDIKYKTKLKDQEIALAQSQLKTKTQNIIVLASLLAILTLVLISTSLWYQRKQILFKKENEEKFTQMLMENTEEERRRIARDLHDSVGHELLSVKNSLSNQINITEGKIDEILNEVREISRNLFPVMFEEVGLCNSLEQLAETTYKSSGVFVNTQLNYTYGKLNSSIELNIYRIIQEALNNIVKYAEAKSCLIGIEEINNEVIITIKDNGKGFDVEETLKTGKAFGLISMQQRAKSIGAHLQIQSSKEGTTIVLTI